MGGRGAASSAGAWNWSNDYDNGQDVELIDKDPIGPENKVMYKDSVKNLSSIYPILEVKNITPVTVVNKTPRSKTLGVAVIGVRPEIISNDKVILTGFIELGFDDKTFATQASLAEEMTRNFESNWNSTGLDNHVVVHEVAHMLDYQLSIKKNANMSLDEFLTPKEVDKRDAVREQNKMMSYFSRNKRFSAGFADELRKEMKQSPDQILGQISEYAQRNEAEFFAEGFTKWYLSKNKNGHFEKSFEKVLKNRISKI